MQIGILGTGRMGARLAAMFADSGHEVVLGSRDLSRAKRIASGLRRANIAAGSYERAIDAPIVLLGSIDASEAAAACEAGLEITVATERLLESVHRAVRAEPATSQVAIHLKVDETGA